MPQARSVNTASNGSSAGRDQQLATMKPHARKLGPKSALLSFMEQAGISSLLSKRFYQRAILSTNAAQGTSGEHLVLAAILELLREDPNCKASGPPKEQHALRTPDGTRRLDLYFGETGFAIEIKSGYVRATKEFRKQVNKDLWLLSESDVFVSEVMWIFLRGATVNARRYLDQNRIAWIDFDLDNQRPPTMSDWPKVHED